MKEGLWKERRIRTKKVVTFDRFVEFLTTAPLEGLGEDPAAIKRMLSHDPESLTLFEEAMVGQHGGSRAESKSDNVTLAERGNTKGYTLRRLKKDHPELHAKVCAGEMSANAAAIEAGVRKVPNALSALQKAWRKASKKERLEFVQQHRDAILEALK